MNGSCAPGAPSPARCDRSGGGECPYLVDFIELQKQYSLGRMTREVVHDLNNLFSIMMGHAELAMDEATRNGASTRRLRGIREAVDQAAALCREMLTYAGHAPPVRTKVDLAALLAQMQPLLRGVVPQNGRIECQMAPELPPVTGDPRLLRHALVNLVQNAVEAGGGEPPRIRLEVDVAPVRNASPSAPPWVRIRVSDKGCGMDEEARENLYRPFDSLKGPGRGMGLSVVRVLLESMGGTIDLQSAPGQGTRVELQLPVFGEDDAAPDAAWADEGEDDPDWVGSGTVLLADDEPELRAMGSSMLGRAGLRVMTATDGLDAIQCFERHAGEIDLVFLDVVMPRMDGCEALARIRQLNPATQVVMISGHSETDLTRRWNGARPDGILLKPVSAAKLRRAAMRHLTPRKGSPEPAAASIETGEDYS
jgi:two-component system, cell cycle sensor histidine kinase and response regulator CckA